MAKSLEKIIQKMAIVNENMYGISKQSREVQDVATVWRHAFSNTKDE